MSGRRHPGHVHRRAAGEHEGWQVFGNGPDNVLPREDKACEHNLEVLGVPNPYPAYKNGVDPVLRAIIEVNPDAVSIAAERDEERQRGRTRGPLHGIPFVVKDVSAMHARCCNFHWAKLTTSS